MLATPLNSLSLTKYERLLPRIFAGATQFEIHDRQGQCLWASGGDKPVAADYHGDAEWVDFDGGIKKRELPSGQVQFRVALLSKQQGEVGWFTASYDMKARVPVLVIRVYDP